MIVFRNQQHEYETSQLIEHLRLLIDSYIWAPAHDTAAEILIDSGELETGITDALCPSSDTITELTCYLRQISFAIAKLFYYSWQSDPSQAAHFANIALKHFEGLQKFQLPPSVIIRVSEGYAYYSLYPETYIQAAQAFYKDKAPRSVCCVGLRSIGTSLSAVVWAALDQDNIKISSFTIRPRSEPFERTPSLDPALLKNILSANPQYIAIIDEGPGLSGSSICGTASALISAGIDPARIIIFPSWIPDGSKFVNPLSRDLWPKIKNKYLSSFEDTLLKSAKLWPASHSLIDVSRGIWRKLSCASIAQYPPVHRHHEKRKYLLSDDTGPQFLFKFAGLGKYGRSKLRRSQILASEGFSPDVHDLKSGFLQYTWISASPLPPCPPSRQTLDALAQYLAFIKENFPAPSRAISFDYMCHMIENNISKGLGRDWACSISSLSAFRSAFDSAAPIELDNRMMPHEWISSQGRLIKTDSACHFSDHFFPGPADIAWDAAQAIVEFQLDLDRQDYFLSTLSSLLNNDLRPRLDFFLVAYLSFRLGYATFAYNEFGNSLDGELFRLLADRCSNRLKIILNRLKAH